LPPLITQKGPPQEQLLAALAAVEAACIPGPWGEKQLRDVLGMPGVTLTYVRGESASAEAAPICIDSYCIVQQIVDELEILQIATHPAAQRRGHARRLVEHALGEAAAAGCVAAFLEVRRNNGAAIALYERAGFSVCGVRRGYYPPLPSQNSSDGAAGRAEDALVLRCNLAPDRHAE
jgi:ribosomal-protein-alanine N-acetyltransferase